MTIAIYRRILGTNTTAHWKDVNSIAEMCLLLGNLRRTTLPDIVAAQPFVAVHLDTRKPVMRLPDEEFYAITIGEDEMYILNLSNPHGKFALPLLAELKPELAMAMNKLLIHRWIELIDVSPVVLAGKGAQIYRVFLLTPMAFEWLRGVTVDD